MKTVHGLGARVMRLDAVPFLGIEPEPGERLARHFKHPLSVQGTNTLAFLIRKLGGFSFHELNVPLRELKAYTEHGPDLSYDFFTRAQCLHALLTEDATLLRQAFQFLLDEEVQPGTLVHDLQNHDEITYQLVELDARGDEVFEIGGKEVHGRQLKEKMLKEMRAKVAGDRAPYNKLYRPEKDGVATTFAGFIAAAFEIRDPFRATGEEIERIKKGHLLLAAANAMQPGVFSLSSWDLVGALPIPEASVAERTEDGDFRWINRGGVDLMDSNPRETRSRHGLQRAAALYGSLPEQLDDPNSFVSNLRLMLEARKKYRIAEGQLMAVPAVANDSVCMLAIRVPGPYVAAVTLLNFADRSVREVLDFSRIDGVGGHESGTKVFDILSDEPVDAVPASGPVTIAIPPVTARTIVVERLKN